MVSILALADNYLILMLLLQNSNFIQIIGLRWNFYMIIYRPSKYYSTLQSAIIPAVNTCFHNNESSYRLYDCAYLTGVRSLSHNTSGTVYEYQQLPQKIVSMRPLFANNLHQTSMICLPMTTAHLFTVVRVTHLPLKSKLFNHDIIHVDDGQPLLFFMHTCKHSIKKNNILIKLWLCPSVKSDGSVVVAGSSHS